MEYKPSKKEFVTSVTVASLGVLIFIIFGIFTYKEVFNVEKEIVKTNEVEQGLQNAISAKKQIADLEKDLSVLDSFFIKSDEEAYFLNDLEKVAKAHGVKVATDTIGVDTADTGSDFKETLSVKIRYEGSWSNVIDFLKSVQNMPKALVLNNVELTSKSGDVGVWEGTASLFVYKLK